MASGHRLITWLSGMYIDANTQEELELRTNRAVAAATAADYDVIEPDSDLLILDTFVRALPMSFRPELDKTSQKRARLAWDSHVARTSHNK